MKNSEPRLGKTKQPMWLVYISLFVSGVILLSDTYHLLHLDRWTVKVGIAMIYAAFSLVVGGGRSAGYVAAVVIWVAVLASFLV